jgi:hypothetical protein
MWLLAVTDADANSPASDACVPPQQFSAFHHRCGKREKMESLAEETDGTESQWAHQYVVRHRAAAQPAPLQFAGASQLPTHTSCHPSPPLPILRQRQDETPVSFTQYGIELGKNILGRNALHSATIDLATAALTFFTPSGFSTFVRRTFQFL